MPQTDKQSVRAKYPEAVCMMNPDNGRYKIFNPYLAAGNTDSEAARTWIALSRSWEMEEAAWSEAAGEVARRKEIDEA